MVRRCLAALFVVFIAASPAVGQETTVSAGVDASSLRRGDVDFQPARGRLLPVLYVSLAALNVYDGTSTTTALKRGATEANPMMAGIAGHPAALWAVKAGVTTGSIAVAERLWRQHHRGAAIAMMIVSNGLMVAVTAQNASVIRGMR